MSGREYVELDVRLRLDPLEPHVLGTLTLTETVGGMPMIVVRDLQRVDELELGHVAAMLLVNAAIDQQDDAVAEFDRNRAVVRPSGDIDPNEMGRHGIAFLNERADRSRSEWYWAGYRDGRMAR